MSGMAGSVSMGRGGGREDLPTRLLGWWMRLEHRVGHWRRR